MTQRSHKSKRIGNKQQFEEKLNHLVWDAAQGGVPMRDIFESLAFLSHRVMDNWERKLDELLEPWENL